MGQGLVHLWWGSFEDMLTRFANCHMHHDRSKYTRCAPLCLFLLPQYPKMKNICSHARSAPAWMLSMLAAVLLSRETFYFVSLQSSSVKVLQRKLLQKFQKTQLLHAQQQQLCQQNVIVTKTYVCGFLHICLTKTCMHACIPGLQVTHNNHSCGAMHVVMIILATDAASSMLTGRD